MESALRRNMRSTLAAAGGAAIAFCLTTAVTSPPGLAHSGGKAIPLVHDLTLAPAAQGWTASVAVVDYLLALPRARPGEVRLTLRIRTLPGGSPVTDFAETYTRTLVRGETLHVVGASPSVPAGRGADAGMFVGGAGALLVVAVFCSLLAIRNRPPARLTSSPHDLHTPSAPS